MSKLNDVIRAMFRVGSPLSGVVYAALCVIIAVLLLTIGLWKTLFIAAFALLGGLIGGVASKKEFVRGVINRRFPAKDQPYDDYEDLKNK